MPTMPKSGPRLRRKPMKPNVPSGVEIGVAQEPQDPNTSNEVGKPEVKAGLADVLTKQTGSMIVIKQAGLTLIIKS